MRQSLTVQHISMTKNVEPFFRPASAEGEEFVNDQWTFLYVKNTSDSGRYGAAIHPDPERNAYPITIPAHADVITRVFMSDFNQPGTLRVFIDWNDPDGLEIAAFSARRV